MTTIAFLGLGHMGGPMAANLVKAGHTVRGFDPVPAACEHAASEGVAIQVSAREAVTGADVIITMLPNGKLLLDLYTEILSGAPASTLLIDCSTVDVADAREAESRAASSGHRMVDAPVSGGVVGATAATLTFMVGGDDANFAAAEPILAAMGKKIVHCGGPGSGQAAKICNNMILGISMIAVSEAFVLAEALGLSSQALYDVASTASGSCWALNTNCPVPGPVPTSPANRDYEPGFAVALMAKDLGLAANALREHGVAGELGLRAAERYANLRDTGHAGKDFSDVINEIRTQSGEGAN
ncbi:3-hydroxyisobutyrate dehydrogenase [Tomitella biformata]|uniref:3-hydroxyisobutyrate dehydrogenase n=1 Tax=Tomitella biformata TaxID=630403 RepID=UPI000465CCA3|nr:3-hydroxyisobutyrate dehydrogenase [Tomitella biformata]